MDQDTASAAVSRILKDASGENRIDMGALMPLVYDQLRAIAARKMVRERPGHTLSTTALVNEAYLKLVGQDRLDWRGRGHFYAAAAAAMRRILIDHARAKGSAKRGGGRCRLPLDVVDLASRADVGEIMAVHDALLRLEKEDSRLAEIVNLRFFAGLTEKETALALGRGERTVRRDWLLARAWLHRELAED